jgi:hypothetical protein
VDDMLAISKEGDFDYIVFTNSDIGLHDSFYNKIASIIENWYDAFTINRKTIAKKQ